MANYTKTTDFAAKDSLPSGNAGKVVKGAEHDTEYENIQAAVATKSDAANGAHTGSTSVVNLTVSGTLTATLDGGTY